MRVPKIRKSLRNARERGVQKFCQSGDTCFQREPKHMRTLNNTEWGGRGKMQHFIDPSIRPQQVPGRNICFFLQTFCPWRKTLIY